MDTEEAQDAGPVIRLHERWTAPLDAYWSLHAGASPSPPARSSDPLDTY